MTDLLKALGISTMEGTREEVVGGGLSGARVTKVVDSRDRVVAFIKSASPDAPHLGDELRYEAERLSWLAVHGVIVPEVMGLVTKGGTFLVTRPLEGVPASDQFPADERFAVVTALAQGLRALHTLDSRSCPFDRSLPSALAAAERRVQEGLVDNSWRLAGKEDVRAADALRDLQRAISTADRRDLVVSHGDFCLPNALILPTGSVGFVDVGRAGVADRHSDVADMLRSLRSHMNPQYGEAYAQHFLDIYGRTEINKELLILHDMVEEFFWPAPNGSGGGMPH
ncbi:aminoglycoside 3'-phosphotransferase [Streptomyces sp. NPDC001185]|uniref:aminoglycoside 3'-phosphotransferase n=1 Tax=Streptomyces sp. NPDC001185 TaxID=3154380 RepID=UPI00332B8BD7